MHHKKWHPPTFPTALPKYLSLAQNDVRLGIGAGIWLAAKTRLLDLLWLPMLVARFAADIAKRDRIDRRGQSKESSLI